MAETPLLSLSESIKKAVQHPSNCSTDTVTALQRLLSGSPPTLERPKEVKTTKRSVTVTRNQKSTKPVKPRIAAKVSIFQSQTENDVRVLSRQEKLVLATEIFNTASKSLSEYIKLQQSQPPVYNSAAKSNRTAVKETPSKTPLQLTSPNRKIQSPIKSKNAAKAPTQRNNEKMGATEIAECARLALFTLRELRAPEDAQGKPNIQLEQGLCILIGKLLAAGLHEMAVNDLRVLKSSIQTAIETGSAERQNQRSIKSSRTADRRNNTLVDLLRFTGFPETGPLLQLLISFQFHVLKAVVAEGNPSTLDELLEVLKLASPSSTANLILSGFETGVISADKAAQQLQSLSQNILSLSFSCQTQNSKWTSSISRTRGTAILGLQILSLEIRCLWWGISGHKCEETKELWEPLARYFRTFARRCPTIEKSDFERIKDAFLHLKARFGSNVDNTGDGGLRSPSMSAIMKTLSQLAYSAGCLENAAEFCEVSAASLINTQSIQRAICQCRKALLQVESLRSSTTSLPKITANIDEATENLTAPLKGNQNELDELLMESANLKKTIMKSLSSLTNAQSESPNKPGLLPFRGSAISYMISFVRFLNRYLTTAAASSANNNLEDSPNQSPRKCEKIAIAAVDSAIALAKLPIATKTPSWEIIEPLLCDCFALCKYLNRDDISESASQISTRFLRLSNLYWSYYIAQRDAGKKYCDLLPLVEQSINTLKCCLFPERVSGFMATKLERLAVLFFEIGHANKAEITYVASIRAHIEAGVLSSASNESASKHPRHIWKDPRSPTFALGRVLGYYVKYRLRLDCQPDTIMYDDEDLEPSERAALLERQVAIIMDALSSDPLHATSTLVPSIISNLLAMYPLDTYPIRRSRIILQTLQFLLDSNDSIGQEFSQFIVTEANKCLSSTKLSKDNGLKLLREDVFASLRLAIGFYLGHISTEDLECVIQTWITTVQSCEAWSSIEFRVGDAQSWMSQIKGLIDYLEVRGLWKFRICAISVLNQLLSLQEKGDFSMMVMCSRMMGLQYSRLGYSEKAGPVLVKAKAIIEQNDIDPQTVLSWHLAFAEYFLEVGNYEKSTKSVLAAQSIYETASVNVSKESFRTRTMFERLGVDASHLLSRIFFAKGAINEAIFYAKRAVKSSSRLWARLEKYVCDKVEKTAPENSSSTTDTLAEKIAALDLSSDHHRSGPSYLEGSIYWPHFASHCAALLQLSRVSSHNGFFQDAIYHKEQALTASEAMGASSFIAMIKAELGSCWLVGGQLQKGKGLLEMARDELNDVHESINSLSLNAHLATLYSYDGEPEEAYHTLGNSCQALSSLSRGSLVNSLDPFAGSEIEIKMKDFNIGSSSIPGPSEATRSLRSRTVKRAQKPNPRHRPEKSAATAPDSNIRCSLLSHLNGSLLRQQASLLLSTQNLGDVVVLLDEAERLTKSEMDQVNHRICKTQYLLAKSVQKLATHSVYCVLPESTMSLPSIDVVEKASKERPAASNPRNTRNLTSTRRIKPLELSPKKNSLHHEQDFSEFLSIAKKSLTDLPLSTTLYGSSRDGHQVSYLLNRISMLSFTTGSAYGAIPEPIQATSALELGRNSAMIRERYSILADKELSGHMKRLEWPGAPKTQLDSNLAEHSDFMKDYVDILPEDWDVISITLSPNHDEFIISKLRTGQSPFILCLPLKRGGDDDMDEETFDFDEGKEELLEVIKLANESAHNTQARFDKKAKKKWWANREALDERLKDLLHNVEAVWLGGFRGIFSQKPRNDIIISKFVDCFQKILDKHLPSRRRKRGKARNIYPNFDQRVMELFLNIGNLDDSKNPEESVIDLLYFIVDILQFHGERNAYDEIDFDMMVVETLDALRSYDEAERREQAPTPSRHTILILDKALHSFPWESLECLQNSSVSRMPSLHSVREKILHIQNEDIVSDGSTGFYVNQNSGSYILNPGGDLKSTQTTFETSLSTLKDWTGIIQKDPTEEDFEKALGTKDLLLYFGHGSGAQYIRGRTIRRLDHCAVTFLMGCSSGSMTEAGEFEPYGTPWNYMHAGAPALVATLWDVTDKDIDRFAKSAFEEWGLLSRPTKSSSIDGGFSPDSGSPGGVGLDTAVAKSRDACILRYLNGAAPVVYGVPVFLK